MAIVKADTYTVKNKQHVFYSDFPNSFTISPIGDELGRLINERAVTQSIRNLIFTIKGERLFQPNVGSTLFHSNFNMNDNLTDLSIAQTITNTIQTYESRCNLISVSAVSNFDKNVIDVTITYSLINNTTPINVNIILKRIR